MSNLLISLALGIAAALIDTVPMFIKGLDRSFIVSAFLFWTVLGVIIPQTSFSAINWLNGTVTSLLLLIPMLSLIFKVDRAALPIIIGTTVVLGAVLGQISGILIR